MGFFLALNAVLTFFPPPDEHREACGLSTDVYRKTDYDRLALSLSSPMPNEQDFGINVATLLSNEGKHNLKLVRCPRLVNLLLGHAGIFNHRKFCQGTLSLT